MTIKSTVSTATDPNACARELRAGLGQLEPAFVIFFATSKMDPESLGAALRREFGDVPSIGCTTAGEITTGRLLDGSIVLMAMDADSLASVHLSVAKDGRDDAAVVGALDDLQASMGTGLSRLDPEKYVGLVLHDGLAGAEERVMARVSAVTNVPFVGGSAADDLALERTHVFHQFRPMVGASLFAILELTRPYVVLKTQSMKVTDKVLEVTEADPATRTAKSFNGRPAAIEYAAQLGIPLSDLSAAFLSSPVGLVVDGEPFVRSPMRIQGSEVVFYCEVNEGSQLHILESQDIVAQTKADLDRSMRELAAMSQRPVCAAILNFHCIVRTLELKEKHQTEAYGALFREVPTVGFSTYGESYVGHINQTSTMILFA